MSIWSFEAVGVFFSWILSAFWIRMKLFVEDKPGYDPKETAIYKIFGFNHSCNVMDHMPAREVAALMSIFCCYPFVLFHIISFFRIRYDFLTDEIPEKCYTISKIVTPINILSSAYIFLWFVNIPDGEYGFVAHYLPYMAFQLMIVLTEIQQVEYMIAKNRIPFNISDGVAKFYYRFLIYFTIFFWVYVSAPICV